MSVVDLCIIIFLIFGFLIGWKNGLTKQLVLTVGFLIVIILSFILKNYLSSIFYTYLPFFEFGGVFKGVSALNILLYELLAFVIVLCLLMVIFRVLLKVTSVFEKILKMTIILGIPSKLLGGVVGIINNFAVSFFVLYFLSIPVLNFTLLDEAPFAQNILDSTPVLSNICSDTLNIYDEIKELKVHYKDNKDNSQLNKEVLSLLLEHDIISNENVQKLISRGKIAPIDN